jgi:uncharacterized protein YciI
LAPIAREEPAELVAVPVRVDLGAEEGGDDFVLADRPEQPHGKTIGRHPQRGVPAVTLRMGLSGHHPGVFFVVLRRTGPAWDFGRPLEEQSGWPEHAAFMDGLVAEGFVVLGGPLADETRVVLAVEAESEEAVRATLARDPWSETHLVVEAVDTWTIRLDGRRSPL